MNIPGTKLPTIELARIRISNHHRFSQQCFKLRSAVSRLESLTLVAPGLPLEVPVVPPGGVPVVAAMMVLLDFILNATTRGRQAGSLRPLPSSRHKVIDPRAGPDYDNSLSSGEL